MQSGGLFNKNQILQQDSPPRQNGPYRVKLCLSSSAHAISSIVFFSSFETSTPPKPIKPPSLAALAVLSAASSNHSLKAADKKELGSREASATENPCGAHPWPSTWLSIGVRNPGYQSNLPRTCFIKLPLCAGTYTFPKHCSHECPNWRPNWTCDQLLTLSSSLLPIGSTRA